MTELMLAAQKPTMAGNIITYFVFPLLVLATMASIGGAIHAYRSSKARAVALALAAQNVETRLTTQDGALARLLEVINPVGAPNLTSVLARIQLDGEMQAKRLDDHIVTAAADKAAFERRLELIRMTGNAT